jgi:hypothetical protein
MDLRYRDVATATHLRLIRGVPPLRWLEHVASPYAIVVGVKR